MPCESCNVQFTIFKRKRNCNECKRFYCNHCLVKLSNSAILCEKCIIFLKRPLLKIDLQKLKPKDLIFYLQSKHISTKGCVEKDELVNLILAHVDSLEKSENTTTENLSKNKPTNATSFKNSSSSQNFCNKMGSQDNLNPFDQIKQNCQNFFTNFTEKISVDLNLSGDKVTSPQKNDSELTESRNRSVINQPIASNSEYLSIGIEMNQANMANREDDNRICSADDPGPYFSNLSELMFHKGKNSNTNSDSSTPTSQYSIVPSPINTDSSQSPLDERSITSKQHEGSNFDRQGTHLKQKIFKNACSSSSMSQTYNIENGSLSSNYSSCECSENEKNTIFKTRKRKTDSINKEKRKTKNNQETKILENSHKKCEAPSESYFEELGAVGGIKITNFAPNLVNSRMFNENKHLQSIEKELCEEIEQISENCDLNSITTKNESILRDLKESSVDHSALTTIAVFNDHGLASFPSLDVIDIQQPRIIRRRSDGYIYNQSRVNNAAALEVMYDIVKPDVTNQFPLPGRSNVVHGLATNMSPVDEESDNEDDERSLINKKHLKKICSTCGKRKKNLKKQVLEFKKHLENSSITEDDIKRELDCFIKYLENRSKSFDGSEDSEGSNRELQFDFGTFGHRLAELHYEAAAVALLGEEEGIHVYANSKKDMNLITNKRYDNRFLNLRDFETKDEIDGLSVKQLKEILMLNRIDYKGCCEKQELLERVHRLWKNLQECPTVEKLHTDELCKICMDAPIECVILECGHLATCTNCGKVLNECPICRQYIVRVVRFFRA